MKCQKCNINEANTHITQVINGIKTEVYLCKKCAAENSDLFSITSNLDHEFDSLFSNFWGTPKLNTKQIYGEKKCELCGMTQSVFLKTGKPGCHNCYTVFSDFFLRPLKQIHGSTKHTGKTPLSLGDTFKTESQISNLEVQLSQAVLQQNFEEAAILRDKIKKLKENSK